MSASGLAEILNRRIWWAELQESWARRSVCALTEALAQEDCLGLLGPFGAPRSEYEPEAVLLLAEVFGAREVWDSRRGELDGRAAREFLRRPRSGGRAPITPTAVQDVFERMFGQELCREQDFAEAATRCEGALTAMCWPTCDS